MKRQLHKWFLFSLLFKLVGQNIFTERERCGEYGIFVYRFPLFPLLLNTSTTSILNFIDFYRKKKSFPCEI